MFTSIGTTVICFLAGYFAVMGVVYLIKTFALLDKMKRRIEKKVYLEDL